MRLQAAETARNESEDKLHLIVEERENLETTIMDLTNRVRELEADAAGAKARAATAEAKVRDLRKPSQDECEDFFCKRRGGYVDELDDVFVDFYSSEEWLATETALADDPGGNKHEQLSTLEVSA